MEECCCLSLGRFKVNIYKIAMLTWYVYLTVLREMFIGNTNPGVDKRQTDFVWQCEVVCHIQGWIGYAGTHVPMFVHKPGLIKPRQTQLCPKLWALWMKISLGFFVYFGQLLSGLSLIVGFFKNFGIVIVFSWLFQQLKMDKARNTPLFLLVWDGLLLKVKVFWLTLFNTEDKRRNGDCQDIIFVLLSGLILKTCLCCNLWPKSGLD